MHESHLHIVSFDVPYPPNYGGVIDVYYKIRELARHGVKVHLHCFEYARKEAPELEPVCFRVHYYPRLTGWRSNLSLLPYIVRSRRSDDLAENLLRDDYPIIFEGLHSCYYLGDKRFAGRLMVYRESNIEHHYYRHLAMASPGLKRKIFFFTESIRLQLFQRRLRHASLMLTVSRADLHYLQSRFPGHKILLLPSFHAEDTVDILPGRGSYALYHGKLSVPENEQAALYLIEKIWQDDMPELIVAGMSPPASILKAAERKKNIRISADPNEAEMTTLIRNAHLHIMVTFQPTGLKLKLLRALFNGRFCLVNSRMLAGTALHDICETADEPGAMKELIHKIFRREFTPEMIQHRSRILESMGYHNEKNCKMLLEVLNLSF